MQEDPNEVHLNAALHQGLHCWQLPGSEPEQERFDMRSLETDSACWVIFHAWFLSVNFFENFFFQIKIQEHYQSITWCWFGSGSFTGFTQA